jgi:hypothetical protein
MQITDSLNLALPAGDGLTAYHTPISRSVYETHYSVINAVKAALSRKGIHYQMGSGPRIANLVLKDEGEKDAAERDSFDAKGNVVDERTPALLAELKRLTTILAPGTNGYDMLPVDAAISQGKIDDEDYAELEAALVFFTCHAMTARKTNRSSIATATASVLNGSISPLGLTGYAASLQTLTKTVATPSQASSQPVSDTPPAMAFPI